MAGMSGGMILARKEIRGRSNWQSAAMARGQGAELVFKTFFEGYFKNTGFRVIAKPKDFKTIYAADHGIEPDFKIINDVTGKMFFVEIKRQYAGRGNAHERACRYFTPGMVKHLKKYCNVKTVMPMWLVFSNGITTDKKRVREVKFWFDGYEENYLFWANLANTETIKVHFDTYIRPHLEKK